MASLWAPIITTAGALVGSFGGYLLAAQSQLRSEERKDARDREAVERSRAATLEDQRHEHQRTTLLSLQELLRAKVRTTLQVIEQDRKAVKEYGEYRQLPEELDVQGYEAEIEFNHLVARVTDDALRGALEALNFHCARVSMPPEDHPSFTRDQALALQEERFNELIFSAQQVSEMLGRQLRAELNRDI